MTQGGGGGGWQQGFDFRNTAGFVSDPAGDIRCAGDHGLSYERQWGDLRMGETPDWYKGGIALRSRIRGWQGSTSPPTALPATFYVDLPSPGTYNMSLAMGDAGYQECWAQCQVQFLDGNTVVATITKGQTNQNYFDDARGNNWSGGSLADTATLASR